MKSFLGTLLFICVGLAILNLSVGIAYHEPFNFIVGVMFSPPQGMQSKDIPRNMATIEHLKRKEEGGKNNHGNLRLACFDCNTGRGSVDWMTYKSYKMGELTFL